MQIFVGVFYKNPAIKIPLQNPSKVEQIYFEYIIKDNLLQYLSE